MIIITGAAGFIGSNIVKALNAAGETRIAAVDDFSRGEGNLRGCAVELKLDKREFREQARRGRLPEGARAVLHQGACADTMETDRAYMMDNNLEYSRELLDCCLAAEVPLVYASSASVYGNNRDSRELVDNESPINVYAESKLAFDNHVRPLLKQARSTVVGLRYFNVYGPREASKGRMASMVYQINRQLRERGAARLFAGTDGFADGEQRRDFVFVGDAAEANFFFMRGGPHRGIYNVGTGRARSFNDVARAQIAALGQGRIAYVPFPEQLRGKYQSFTEANLDNLRAAGFSRAFTSLEEGVAQSLPDWAG